MSTAEPSAPEKATQEKAAQEESAREEQPHLAAFQRFHAGLGDTRDVFYMFFTSGLLHWVLHASRFVPRGVKLVLLGSNLTPEEDGWIRANLDRPFHHIRLPVDDVTVWQFLFATSEHNFGWLDIDCFVLDPRLFTEITTLDSTTSMNCTWSWDSGMGYPIANTHFLYLNVDAIRAVEARGVVPNPGPYSWDASHRPFRQRECFMYVPTAREQEILLEILPADEQGRPTLARGGYFNTLVLYQLLARTTGYTVDPIRPLQRRFSSPRDATDTDPTHWPEDMSDELFHLFGVSYYTNSCHHPGIRALFLAAEYTMLDDTVALLPAQYAERHAELAQELTTLTVDPDKARHLFQRHLVDSRRLTDATADRITTLLPAPDAGRR